MYNTISVLNHKIKSAVVAGHICLDVLPQMDHLPNGVFDTVFQPGHLISVGEAIFATGGPVSNVGLALHKMRVPTRLIAKTGNDPYGQILQDIIAGFGANLLDGVSTDEAQPTSYSIIISPPDVDRIFLHCPGVNDTFKATDIDFDLLADADLMHFGYPPIMKQMYKDGGAELVAVFRKAKETGITTSLDMAFPDPASPGGQADWREILGGVLPFVDIFTPSFEEILFMLHREKYDRLKAENIYLLEGITPDLISELSAELLGMGPKIILLKLGNRGAYLRTTDRKNLAGFGRGSPQPLDGWASQEIWSPCYQVETIGTTGSGDATIAGFLSAILRNKTPIEAIDASVAVGACNVEAYDALSGLLSWEDTMNRIARGWKKHNFQLPSSDWIWQANHQVWLLKT